MKREIYGTDEGKKEGRRKGEKGININLFSTVVEDIILRFVPGIFYLFCTFDQLDPLHRTMAHQCASQLQKKKEIENKRNQKRIAIDNF